MENKALTIIKRETEHGAMIYAARGLEDTAPLYKAEATIIDVTPADFHNLKGKLVAKKETCDRIGEAAGVSFIAAQCGVKTEMRDDDLGRRTVFVGYAQGRTRLPDGSWRESAVEEYEFDPVLRAKMDAGNKSEGSLKLDYMRCARQRASTGARLRVIRQLTGMPTAFESAAIGQGKPLVFSRVVQNTDYILATKEGRMMAIAAATGVAAQLYGPRQAPEAPEPQEAPEELRNVSAEPAASADDWGDDEPAAPATDPRVAELQTALHEYIASGSLPQKGIDMCQGALDRGESDPIILEDLVRRAKAAHEKSRGAA